VSFSDESRQTNYELASTFQALTADRDATRMHFNDSLHERQANIEPSFAFYYDACPTIREEDGPIPEVRLKVFKARELRRL
jgi:hypothetical protein